MERIESSASCLAFPRARLLSILPRSMMANIKTFAVRPSVQKVQHSRRRIIKICSWKMNSTEMDRSAQIIINILNVECAIGIGRFTRLPPGPRRRPSLLLQLVQRRIPHTHHHLVVIVIVGAAPLLILFLPLLPHSNGVIIPLLLRMWMGIWIRVAGWGCMVQLNVQGRIIIC